MGTLNLSSSVSVTPDNYAGPTFSAYKSASAGNQSLTSGSWTKITFDEEDYDTNGTYDTSTSRFIPNVAGYYWICASAYIDYSGTAITRQGLKLVVNGSTTIGDYTTGNTAYYGYVQTSGIFYFDGIDDYVEAYAIQVNGTSAYAYGGPAATKLQGYLVRAA